MSSMPTFAPERRQTLTHGGIEALSQGSMELLASQRHVEQVVCFLKRPPRQLARHRHDPFLLGACDHRRETQARPPLSTRSSPARCLFPFFAKGTHDALWIRIAPICSDQPRLDGPAAGTNPLEQTLCQGLVSVPTSHSCQP